MSKQENLKNLVAQNVGLSELCELTLAPGNIYLKLRDGKIFKLLNAGEIIYGDDFSRYRGQFLIEYCSDKKNIEDLKQFLSSFLSERAETYKAKARKDFLIFFNELYSKNGRGHKLDWVLATFEVLYKPKHDFIKEFDLNNSQLLINSFLQASTASFLMIVLGYLDLKFIQDVYLALLCKDISLWKENFYLNEAAKRESKKFFSGLKYLEETSPTDLEKFKKHPQTSLKIVREKVYEDFNNPHLLDLIKWQHSYWNYGVRGAMSSLSDYELMIIYVDKIMGHKNDQYQLGDGKDYLSTIIGENDSMKSMSKKINYWLKREIA